MQAKLATSSTATKVLASTTFLNRAQRLLGIPSVYSNREANRQALAFMEQIAQTTPGVTIEHFEHNGVKSFLAYCGPQRPERFKVLLNGHVDVVPAKTAELTPTIKNDRLYGRGALDMKAAALVLADAFVEFAPKVTYPLGLQIVTDEEPGGFDGAKYQFDQGVRTDFFLTGEQSWNDVATAAKGMCRLIITQRGVSAHSAYQWRGENALLKLTNLVQKIHAIYPPLTEETWVTSVNVANIKTSDDAFFNRVPDTAELHLDIRPVVEDPNFRNETTIRDFIATLDPTAQIISLTFERGHDTPATDPLVQKLIAAASQAKGTPVSLLRRHGQCDIRHYNPDPQCRGVEFGLKGKHDHGDGEYVDIKSIPIMQRAMKLFLESI